MIINCDNKEVGNLYINLQISMSAFPGKHSGLVIDMIRGTHGQTQKVFSLNIGSFKIKSFRRIYNEGTIINIEGAELEPVL